MLRLRKATMNDALLLFNWRNDPQTRLASHNQEELTFESHLSWLKAVLENPKRTIYIAEENNTALGTIRADRLNKASPEDTDGEYTELSWNVAPTARGQGVAKKMLRAILPLLSGLIKAEIKKDNIASIKVAEAVGMTLKTEKNGILFYELTKQ